MRIIGSQYEAEISGKEGANNMCLTELAKRSTSAASRHSIPVDEIDSMVEAAIRYHFAAVFTLPAFSSYVAKKHG